MHAKLMALASVSLLAVACGAVSANPADGPTDVAIEKSTAKKTGDGDDAVIAEEAKQPAPLARREVGDFFVHRFSGSFAKEPLVLTEEVHAKKGALIVIDYTLEEGKKKSTLRVTHDVDTDRVLRVISLQGDQEKPAKIEAFEAMMAKTVFVPDSNERKLDSEKTTCLVSGDELDCEQTSYEVTVGNSTAKLTVTTSESVPGQDLGGEIVTGDGKVIYRAELVESGKGSGSSVASR